MLRAFLKFSDGCLYNMATATVHLFSSELRNRMAEGCQTEKEGSVLNQNYAKTGRMMCVLATNCSLRSVWMLEDFLKVLQAKHKCGLVSPKSLSERQRIPI
ncbi:hypothetical protein AVEN_149253-1 [Araneus ventricosus]|uniref:Uncharacterized protein n=1 Tax=Araneus ventricosus TaxID=182803 RepID=A0A4Y2WGG1_ARAVE|nr:hypothetical protein AVEN_149253-1 [Araneus ventricosus]